MHHITTPDLFRSASLLCLGAELERVEKDQGSTRFVLCGNDLKSEDINYKTGKARINPLELKVQLNQLRDIIFNKSTSKRNLKVERIPNDRTNRHRAA